MKYLYTAFLIIACLVSYAMGKDSCKKDYQAACIFSDIARNMADNIGNDAEEIYHEYIDNLEEYNLDLTQEDLKEYCWCY